MRPLRKIRCFLADSRGAVTMEYLLLCVMIATASLMMVVTFSRAVVRRFALVSYAMAGYSQEQLEETRKQFSDAVKDDVVVGNVFSDYMHGDKVNMREE